jgi:hypothetical protein
MTTKHGTASQVNGSYEESQAAVLRALPHDIDTDPALRWTQSGEYPLSVDYERSVEDAVKLGRYDWANPDITSKNFPTKRTGTAEIVVELIHFNRVVSTDEALRKLGRMGYRPADLHELLAFGEKYPEVQREFPVVALASVWHYRLSFRYVPYLSRYSSKRNLYLNWIKNNWNELCRFAAVRKEH